MSGGSLALVAVGALVVLVVTVFFLMRRGKGGGGRGAAAELVRMCRGDRAQAERLIAGQQRRNPGLSRAAAAERAVRAWRRDLR